MTSFGTLPDRTSWLLVFSTRWVAITSWDTLFAAFEFSRPPCDPRLVGSKCVQSWLMRECAVQTKDDVVPSVHHLLHAQKGPAHMRLPGPKKLGTLISHCHEVPLDLSFDGCLAGCVVDGSNLCIRMHHVTPCSQVTRWYDCRAGSCVHTTTKCPSNLIIPRCRRRGFLEFPLHQFSEHRPESPANSLRPLGFDCCCGVGCISVEGCFWRLLLRSFEVSSPRFLW